MKSRNEEFSISALRSLHIDYVMIETDHWLIFLKNRVFTIIFSLVISSVISIRKRTFTKRTFVSDPSGSRTRFRSADSLFVEK